LQIGGGNCSTEVKSLIINFKGDGSEELNVIRNDFGGTLSISQSTTGSYALEISGQNFDFFQTQSLETFVQGTIVGNSESVVFMVTNIDFEFIEMNTFDTGMNPVDFSGHCSLEIKRYIT